jgi:hypothetical protein
MIELKKGISGAATIRIIPVFSAYSQKNTA